VVLIAFVLVLAAAASFAAGIAASRTSDGLVYVSILFSLAAFVMLAIASLRARETARGTEGDWGTARLRSLDDTEASPGPLVEETDRTEPDVAPVWTRPRRRTRTTDQPREEPPDIDEVLEAEEDEADFVVPIEPVVPQPPIRGEGRIPDVSPVAAPDEEDDEGDDLGWGPSDEAEVRVSHLEYERHEVVEDDALDVHDDMLDVHEDDDDVLDVHEPEPEPLLAEEYLLDVYDDLTAAEIVPRLHALDLDDLEWVLERERSGAKRSTVLTQVEQLVVDRGGTLPGAPDRSADTAKTGQD
jgi:hypothetical protein